MRKVGPSQTGGDSAEQTVSVARRWKPGAPYLTWSDGKHPFSRLQRRLASAGSGPGPVAHFHGDDRLTDSDIDHVSPDVSCLTRLTLRKL